MDKPTPSPQDIGISPPPQEGEVKYSKFVTSALALKAENPEKYYSIKSVHRNYMFSDDIASRSDWKEANEETRNKMVDLSSVEQKGYSEKIRSFIRAFLEWRSTDKSNYRRIKEQIRQYLSGNEGALSERMRKLALSKEEWREIYEGILDFEYKNPIELKGRWYEYKNPSTRDSVRELSELEISQVHELVRGCLEDLSLFSIPCTKPLGTSGRNMGLSGPNEHYFYHVYNDESEDVRKDMKGALQTNLLDKIPPALRKNIGKEENADIELVQFFDHPTSPTKIMMLVTTNFPGGGENKHEPRSGGSQYLLALSRGNQLVQQLQTGKCTRLVDHVLRNLAVEISPWNLALVDSRLSIKGMSVSIQDFSSRRIIDVKNGQISASPKLSDAQFSSACIARGAHKESVCAPDISPFTFKDMYDKKTSLKQMGFDERAEAV